MLKSRDREFESAAEYFDYISELLGHPALHTKFENATIESDGISLHLDIFNFNKKAPTIVFIPGTALYALCYSEILYKLGSQGYNIVGFDPRGHGQSGGTRGDYSVTEIITDASNVITYALGRFNKNVSILGSSQGGIIAFYLAAKEKRIQSAICQNFADLTSEDTMQLLKYPGMFRMIKPLLARVSNIVPQTQVPINSYIDVEKIEIRHFGTVKKFLEIDPLALKTISIRALQSLATTPPPCPIEEIETPIMVLTGSEDHIFPLHYTLDLFDRLNCKKRLEIYEGLDHALLHEDSDIVLPPVIEWLKEIYPS